MPLGEADGETGRLYGRILFPSDYSQRSVVFEVGDRSFATTPDGRFVIENIPVGEHWMRVQARSYETITRRIVIEPERYVPAGDLALRMARGKVVGRLVSENGESAAKITVRLSPQGNSVRTNRDGIFQFIAVNTGAHILLVTDDRFFTYNRNFSLEPGEQRNLGNIQVFRRAAAANLPRTIPVVRRGGMATFATDPTKFSATE